MMAHRIKRALTLAVFALAMQRYPGHLEAAQTIAFVTLCSSELIRAFAARYNTKWLIEKNGYLSPFDARAAWLDTTLRRAA